MGKSATNKRAKAEPISIRVDTEAYKAWERICGRLRMTKRQTLEALLLKVDHMQDIGDFPRSYAELLNSPPVKTIV